MTDLLTQRENQKLIEQNQAKMHIKFLKQQRQQFDFADTHQWIAFAKKEEDFLFLCEAFTKWISGIKDGDKRKDELTVLLQGLWRLQSYCGNLETICQDAVAQYTMTEKRNLELVGEKRKVELEMRMQKISYESRILALEENIEKSFGK